MSRQRVDSKLVTFMRSDEKKRILVLEENTVRNSLLCHLNDLEQMKMEPMLRI